ncbi:MAG: hypothetical protein AAGE43_01995 [Pseudomonadota bacterium]
MRRQHRPARYFAVVSLIALGLTGCGGVPLAPTAPSGFDLSGVWVIDEETTLGPGEGRSLRSGFMIQDFPLLAARQMRIEQDARSMGIEYERGSYRDVSWGERRRGIWEVRAGWHEGVLHIYSEAPDTSASELWSLSENGDRLEINIEVRSNREQSFRRVFRRRSVI